MGATKYAYEFRELFEQRLSQQGYAETTVTGYLTAVLRESRDGYASACNQWDALMGDIPRPTTFEEVARRQAEASSEAEEVVVVEQDRDPMPIHKIVQTPQFAQLCEHLQGLSDLGVKGKVLDYIVLQYIGVNEV